MIQIRPDPAPYDDRHFLLLHGREGIGAGERVKVNLGETVHLGRGSRCAYSLKKTPRYLKDRDGDRAAIRGSLAYRTVSRRHCRLSYVAPDRLELENLSPNGTFLDGHRFDRVVLDDVRRKVHTLRLGASGDVIEISCGSLEFQASESA
jgi:hypothetical protein